MIEILRFAQYPTDFNSLVGAKNIFFALLYKYEDY